MCEKAASQHLCEMLLSLPQLEQLAVSEHQTQFEVDDDSNGNG